MMCLKKELCKGCNANEHVCLNVPLPLHVLNVYNHRANAVCRLPCACMHECWPLCAIPPAGQWSEPEGGGLSVLSKVSPSIKRPLHVWSAGDR